MFKKWTPRPLSPKNFFKKNRRLGDSIKIVVGVLCIIGAEQPHMGGLINNDWISLWLFGSVARRYVDLFGPGGYSFKFNSYTQHLLTTVYYKPQTSKN